MRQSAIDQNSAANNHKHLKPTEKTRPDGQQNSGLIFRKTGTLLFTACLSYFILLMPLPGHTAEVLKLKTTVEVEADVVTLGDIFENITRYKREPVFRSPKLGREGTVRLERLIEAAETYNFTFDTPTRLHHITISRPARRVSPDAFKALLIEQIKTLKPLTKGGEYKVEFTNLPQNYALPLSYSGKLKLQKLSYDKFRNSFSAVFLPIEARGREYQTITKGSVIEVIRRPVLSREVKRGDKINSDDLKITTFKPNRVPKNALTMSKNIIGMTAKQNLRIGNFIKSSDIEMPKLIKKNQLVTLILVRPGMSLKTQGKAMDDAGLNETIAIMNIHSKRIVHGVATAPGIVKIQNHLSPAKMQKTAQLIQ